MRLSEWLNLYSFDVMGDVGFSYNFRMVEGEKESDAIKQLHQSMSLLSVFNHISWALNLILRTNFGAKALVRHIDWASRTLADRLSVCSDLLIGLILH
jgi:hypothetical protein